MSVAQSTSTMMKLACMLLKHLYTGSVGVDFTFEISVTIPVNQCSSVSLIDDDIAEGTQTFSLSIKSVSPTGPDFNSSDRVTIEITDDDGIYIYIYIYAYISYKSPVSKGIYKFPYVQTGSGRGGDDWRG